MANTLQSAMNFNRDDLKANRAGELSDAQLKRFQGMAITPGLVLLTGIVAALYGMAMIFRDEVSILAVAMLLFGGLFGGAAYSRLLSIVRVLRNPQITPLTGMVRKKTDDESGVYRLHVDDKEPVIVSEAVYRAFHDKRAYTLYYLPELDMLLSAETA
jgi:hypothetical protein